MFSEVKVPSKHPSPDLWRSSDASVVCDNHVGAGSLCHAAGFLGAGWLTLAV